MIGGVAPPHPPVFTCLRTVISFNKHTPYHFDLHCFSVLVPSLSAILDQMTPDVTGSPSFVLVCSLTHCERKFSSSSVHLPEGRRNGMKSIFPLISNRYYFSMGILLEPALIWDRHLFGTGTYLGPELIWSLHLSGTGTYLGPALILDRHLFGTGTYLGPASSWDILDKYGMNEQRSKYINKSKMNLFFCFF